MHLLIKLLIVPLFLGAAYAAEENQNASEALGRLIGKQVRELGLKIDTKQLVKGLGEPLSEEEEAACLAQIDRLFEEAQEARAKQNRKEAECFLARNKKQPEICELVPGKLQYKDLKIHDGATLQSYNYPLIRYTLKTEDGKILSANIEEHIALDSIIEGLQKGLQGMKAGSCRQIFIHPDLGYGAKDPVYGGLLIYEVELLSCDLPRNRPISENSLQ